MKVIKLAEANERVTYIVVCSSYALFCITLQSSVALNSEFSYRYDE
jgi:hypothetical protein